MFILPVAAKSGETNPYLHPIHSDDTDTIDYTYASAHPTELRRVDTILTWYGHPGQEQTSNNDVFSMGSGPFDSIEDISEGNEIISDTV